MRFTRTVCGQSNIASLCPNPRPLPEKVICAPALVLGTPSPTPGHPAFEFDLSGCAAAFDLREPARDGKQPLVLFTFSAGVEAYLRPINCRIPGKHTHIFNV